MKAWTNLAAIETPHRIMALPRDARGYPIQVTAGRGTDGAIDFRAINMDAWVVCVRDRRCGICGQPLGRFVAFVGGPGSIQSRGFMDAGMHRDCARYACQVCPFIAAPRFAYSRATPELAGQTMVVHEHVSTTRPTYFGLGITWNYTPIRQGDSIALLANPWRSVEWWKEGVRYEHEADIPGAT